MKIPRSIWIWLLAAADIGASTHAQTVTNTVFQKHLTNGWFIKVSEEITENTRPSVHHTNGVVSRFSDCQHWYRFLLGTNSFNAPRQILETEASSFKNDTYSPYRVLDVNLDTTNLVVAYKKRGATFCDIINLESKQGLPWKSAQVLPSEHETGRGNFCVDRAQIEKGRDGGYRLNVFYATMGITGSATNAIAIPTSNGWILDWAGDKP